MELIIFRPNPYFFRPIATHPSFMSHFMAEQMMHQIVSQLFFASVFDNFHQDIFFPQRSFFVQPPRPYFPRPYPPISRQARLEDQIRRDHNIAPHEELYTGVIANHNEQTRERAKATNQDGGVFLKGIISKQDKSFRDKVAESDPEVFAPKGLPTMAVDKLIASKDPLTQFNTPKFAHDHLTNLEKLRKNPSDKNLKDQITTAMHRDKDFVAAIQNAI